MYSVSPTARIDEYCARRITIGDEEIVFLFEDDVPSQFPELRNEDYSLFMKDVGCKIAVLDRSMSRVIVYPPDGPIRRMPYRQLIAGMSVEDNIALEEELRRKSGSSV